MCGGCGRIHDVEIPVLEHKWTDNAVQVQRYSASISGATDLSEFNFFNKDQAVERIEKGYGGIKYTGMTFDYIKSNPYYTWYAAIPTVGSCTGVFEVKVNDETPYKFYITNPSFTDANSNTTIYLNNVEVKEFTSGTHWSGYINLTLKKGVNYIKIFSTNQRGGSDRIFVVAVCFPPIGTDKICTQCKTIHSCSYDSVTQEPSCILGGFTTGSCAVCGGNNGQALDVKPSLGHGLIINGKCSRCGREKHDIELETLTPGLYGNDLTMDASWDELVNDGIIKLRDDGTSIYKVNKGLSGKLVISNSITKIMNESFKSCTLLDFLFIPASVTAVGEDGINDINLTTPIHAPFYGCSNINIFYENNSSRKNPIGWNVISGSDKVPAMCYKFISLTDKCKVVYEQTGTDISDTIYTDRKLVYVIPNNAVSFTDFTVPEGVNYFNFSSLETMNSCENVKNLSLPSTVLVVKPPYKCSCSTYTYSLQQSLDKRTKDEFVQKYPVEYNLENVYVAESNANYKSKDGVLCDATTVLFYPCSKKDEEFTFADSPELIHTTEQSFRYNDYLKKINLGYLSVCNAHTFLEMNALESVCWTGVAEENKSKDYRGFSYCPNLKTVVFPENSYYKWTNGDICNCAFINCGIEEIALLPKMGISNGAFRYCTSLRKIFISTGSTTSCDISSSTGGGIIQMSTIKPNGVTWNGGTVEPPAIFMLQSEDDYYIRSDKWNECSDTEGSNDKGMYKVYWNATKEQYDAY